jgi:hypothetical protein
MARNAKNPPRDAGGRFVRPRDAAPSVTRGPDRGRAETRRSGLGQPVVLSLAIVMGVAGFAFSLFWVASLILMGILWGTMAMERQRQRGEKGLLAEVVEVVVDEAKDIAESASGHNSSRKGREVL